jgi:hypothetical protein
VADTPQNGGAVLARVAALEGNQAETFKRLRMVDRLDERTIQMAKDLKAVRESIEERERQQAEKEKNEVDSRRWTWGQIVLIFVAVIAAGGSIASALVTALAQ